MERDGFKLSHYPDAFDVAFLILTLTFLNSVFLN